MINIAYKALFLIFSFYTLINSTSYGFYEIIKEKNIYGGILVIICTIFSIIFSNIIVWIN